MVGSSELATVKVAFYLRLAANTDSADKFLELSEMLVVDVLSFATKRTTIVSNVAVVIVVDYFS